MQSYPVELLLDYARNLQSKWVRAEAGGLCCTNKCSHTGLGSKGLQLGNVIGELGDEGPRILLCGHMDTVPGEIPVRIEGDLLYGRGAVDAKSSLAAMLVGSILARERSNLHFGLHWQVLSKRKDRAPVPRRSSLQENRMIWLSSVNQVEPLT